MFHLGLDRCCLAVFFSLSVGLGGLVTFAGYNKFHNNFER